MKREMQPSMKEIISGIKETAVDGDYTKTLPLSLKEKENRKDQVLGGMIIKKWFNALLRENELKKMNWKIK